MPKRTSDAAELPNGKSAANGQETARAPVVEEEMGDFEDRWEDDVESEEEVDAEAEAEDGDGEGESLL